MTNPTLDTESQRSPTGSHKGALMRRFKDFWAKPRNRAGLVWAVLTTASFLVIEIVGGHYIMAAVYTVPTFATAFLLGRAVTVEAGRARSDEVGLLAYMPLAVASVTFFLIPALLSNVGKQPAHTLDSFYTAVTTVLAALLVALMIESRGLLHVDPQLQTLRGWWVGCAVIGLIAALTGLTPTHSPLARETAFQAAWAGLAGTMTAVGLVMAGDWLAQLAEKTRYTPGVDAAEESSEPIGTSPQH